MYRATELVSRYHIFPLRHDDREEALFLMLGLDWYGRYYPINQADLEPLDVLSELPIPEIAAKYANLRNAKEASVRDLLSVFLAVPTVLRGDASTRREDTMILALALISSMLIVSSDRFSHVFIDRIPFGEQLRRDLAIEAFSWMDAQMPSHLFHESVEAYIQDASRLMYKTNPTSFESMDSAV